MNFFWGRAALITQTKPARRTELFCRYHLSFFSSEEKENTCFYLLYYHRPAPFHRCHFFCSMPISATPNPSLRRPNSYLPDMDKKNSLFFSPLRDCLASDRLRILQSRQLSPAPAGGGGRANWLH